MYLYYTLHYILYTLHYTLYTYTLHTIYTTLLKSRLKTLNFVSMNYIPILYTTHYTIYYILFKPCLSIISVYYIIKLERIKMLKEVSISAREDIAIYEKESGVTICNPYFLLDVADKTHHDLFGLIAQSRYKQTTLKFFRSHNLGDIDFSELKSTRLRLERVESYLEDSSIEYDYEFIVKYDSYEPNKTYNEAWIGFNRIVFKGDKFTLNVYEMRVSKRDGDIIDPLY